MQNKQKHKRVNDILLGSLERPALQWLAAHMPSWVHSDLLTGLGFVGSLITFAGYILTNRNPNYLWLASVGFIVNWFGDSLDGTLARYRKAERPRFGFYIDHVIDVISSALVFISLGISPYVDITVACFALIGYLMLSTLVYITTYVNGVFKISYAGLGPTELRLMAIIANAVIFFIGNPVLSTPIGQLVLYDIIIAIIAGLLFTFFTVSALTQIKQLVNIDQTDK